MGGSRKYSALRSALSSAPLGIRAVKPRDALRRDDDEAKRFVIGVGSRVSSSFFCSSSSDDDAMSFLPPFARRDCVLPKHGSRRTTVEDGQTFPSGSNYVQGTTPRTHSNVPVGRRVKESFNAFPSSFPSSFRVVPREKMPTFGKTTTVRLSCDATSSDSLSAERTTAVTRTPRRRSRVRTCDPHPPVAPKSRTPFFFLPFKPWTKPSLSVCIDMYGRKSPLFSNKGLFCEHLRTHLLSIKTLNCILKTLGKRNFVSFLYQRSKGKKRELCVCVCVCHLVRFPKHVKMSSTSSSALAALKATRRDAVDGRERRRRRPIIRRRSSRRMDTRERFRAQHRDAIPDDMLKNAANICRELSGSWTTLRANHRRANAMMPPTKKKKEKKGRVRSRGHDVRFVLRGRSRGVASQRGLYRARWFFRAAQQSSELNTRGWCIRRRV